MPLDVVVAFYVRTKAQAHFAAESWRPAQAYRQAMNTLTSDMKRVVDQERLGFFATVCPDGSPNLSPKGTLRISSLPISIHPAPSPTSR
jgi:hypothetical protein